LGLRYVVANPSGLIARQGSRELSCTWYDRGRTPRRSPDQLGLEGLCTEPLERIGDTRKTPDDIIDLIAHECDRIVHLPDVADKIRELGSDPVGGTPEQLARFLKAERPKWEAAIKAREYSRAVDCKMRVLRAAIASSKQRDLLRQPRHYRCVRLTLRAIRNVLQSARSPPSSHRQPDSKHEDLRSDRNGLRQAFIRWPSDGRLASFGSEIIPCSSPAKPYTAPSATPSIVCGGAPLVASALVPASTVTSFSRRQRPPPRTSSARMAGLSLSRQQCANSRSP
jgi:hypothetical protein